MLDIEDHASETGLNIRWHVTCRRAQRAAGTREQRDWLLAEAEVILGGFRFPLGLRARAPRLKWFSSAAGWGESNLRLGDLWGSDVVVTTSRGARNTVAMAEYAAAGVLYLAMASIA